MSTAQSFLVVSTGCLTNFAENSRTRFTNNLAKPARARKPWVNSLYLDVEQVNFEYTPTYYENHTPDFIYNQVMDQTSYKIPKCYSIDDLLLYLRHPVVSGYLHSYNFEGAKITIQPWYDVLIHKKFAEFLNIINQLKQSPTTDYFHLDRLITYTSSTPVKLNRSAVNYVDLICEEITPYFCDGEYKKIIARIDVMNKKNETIHLDTLVRRFYKIQPTSLENLTFELRQPNGSKLLMKEGPPTIIKAKLKEMETNADFFYVQVNSSGTSTFPKNNASSFTTEIPNEIELKGEWEVALTHAELPITDSIFKEEYRVFPVKQIAEIHIVISVKQPEGYKLQNFSIGLQNPAILTLESFLTILKDMTGEIKIYVDENGNPKIYTTQENINAYIILAPKSLAEVMFPSVENTGMNLRKIHEIISYYQDNAVISEKKTGHTANVTPFAEILSGLSERGYEIPEFTYEVNPAKSVDITPSPPSKFIFTFEEYFQNNATLKKKKNRENHNSIITHENITRKTIEEENELLRIHESKSGVRYFSKSAPTWLFLYADFVKPTLIADCYSNVLKLIPYKQNAEVNGRFYTFTPLDFFTVNKESLKTLTFELRTHAGEKHDFRNDKKVSSFTLFFRRIGNQ